MIYNVLSNFAIQQNDPTLISLIYPFFLVKILILNFYSKCFHVSDELTVSLLLWLFHSIWRFWARESDSSHCCDLRSTCGNAGAWTHCAGLGIEPASQGSRDTADLLCHSRNSTASILLSDTNQPQSLLSHACLVLSHLYISLGKLVNAFTLLEV